MCGIAGSALADRDAPADEARVARLVDRMSHRGPDGRGLVTLRNGTLGHARLAIIDLSPAGAQPMRGEDGSVLLASNAEIYNHRELRGWLEAKGHRFTSKSDCEVIVHLYEELGPAAVERLTGMFALALWDARNETLVLARDPLGEKPLFYQETPERIVFASELQALSAQDDFDRSPDPLAIHHYLTFRYVPAPWSGFRAARKLPAGHRLVWTRGRGSRVERYAAPALAAELRSTGGARDHAPTGPELRAAIGRAVGMRLESDVAIGILLSGGIDSAIVAHEASSRTSPLRTFTVGFDEEAYDESAPAAAFAASLGAEHHPIRVRADVAGELPAIVARFGEPFGDSSAVAVWFLAREVRRHVTVAVGGDGGDELFAGYDRHRAVLLAQRFSRPGFGSAARGLAGLAGRLPLRRERRSLGGRLARFAGGLGMSPLQANAAWLATFDEEAKRALYTPERMREVGQADSLELVRRLATGSPDPLDDVLYADRTLALPDDLLYKVDVAAMASALEVRSPLLDPELVRLAAAIPTARKIARGRGKAILREAYTGILPEATIRGRKAGFGLPVDRWLRGPLRPMLGDLLPAGRLVQEGYARPQAIAGLMDDHLAGQANHDDRLWALLCLELWLRDIARHPRA